MQVDPVKPTLKPPGTKRLKLNCDVLLSTSAFKLNLRRYAEAHVLLAALLCEFEMAPVEVGPGGICFFFYPNSLCLIPQSHPVMLALCPTMPRYAN